MSDIIKTIKLDFVNVFLVRAKDGFVLIDTGYTQQWEKLENELISIGCLPDKLKLVIVTHGDFDHAGNGAKLQQKYHAKIAIHQADSLMVENTLPFDRKVIHFLGKVFLSLSKLRVIKVDFDRFKPDILLTDGQNMEEYGFDAKIIHIPGHTKGSIGVLTSDGDFFIGDTLINVKKPKISVFNDNIRDLRNSIRKVNTLNIRMIYPSHGRSFSLDSISSIHV